MDVAAAFTVPAPPAAVWQSLHTDATLALWVPGAERAAWTGPDRIEATVAQSLIGFRVLVDAGLDVVERVPGERLVLSGGGTDRTTGSVVRLELRLEFAPEPARETAGLTAREVAELTAGAAPGAGIHTRVAYTAHAELTGKLAMVGDLILRQRQRELHRQLVGNLTRALAPGEG